MLRRPISALRPLVEPACAAAGEFDSPNAAGNSSKAVFSPFPRHFSPFIADRTKGKMCSARRPADRPAQLPFKNRENGYTVTSPARLSSGARHNSFAGS
jgi:hypothetical protein